MQYSPRKNLNIQRFYLSPKGYKRDHESASDFLLHNSPLRRFQRNIYIYICKNKKRVPLTVKQK